MPVYRDVDFGRLPGGLAEIFEGAARASFFASPAWYSLMARHCMTAANETRVYAATQQGSAAALVLRTELDSAARRLVSLANAYSVEHGVVYARGSNPASALASILDEI